MSEKKQTAEDLLKLKPGGVLVAMHRTPRFVDGIEKPQMKIDLDEEAQVWGTVVAAGPPIETDMGHTIESPVKRGDVIAIGRYSGTKMTIPVIGDVRFVLFGEILLIAEEGSPIAEKLENEQEEIREDIRKLSRNDSSTSTILTRPLLLGADGELVV